jgi:hypothetical protein
MSKKQNPTADELKDMQEKLGGTPLEPRAKWLLKQAVFVLACVVGLIVVLKVASGIWLAIGLTIVAFFAGMLPELFVDLRYGKYREEWELVNGPRPNQGLHAAD